MSTTTSSVNTARKPAQSLVSSVRKYRAFSCLIASMSSIAGTLRVGAELGPAVADHGGAPARRLEREPELAGIEDGDLELLAEGHRCGEARRRPAAAAPDLPRPRRRRRPGRTRPSCRARAGTAGRSRWRGRPRGRSGAATSRRTPRRSAGPCRRRHRPCACRAGERGRRRGSGGRGWPRPPARRWSPKNTVVHHCSATRASSSVVGRVAQRDRGVAAGRAHPVEGDERAQRLTGDQGRWTTRSCSPCTPPTAARWIASGTQGDPALVLRLEDAAGEHHRRDRRRGGAGRRPEPIHPGRRRRRCRTVPGGQRRHRRQRTAVTGTFL